jgi:hypothetical protein
MKPGDFVFISWLDPLSEDEWVKRKDLKLEPCEIHTVGILIEKTKKKVIVALNHDTVNDNVSCSITISTGIITKIRKLDYKR